MVKHKVGFDKTKTIKKTWINWIKVYLSQLYNTAMTSAYHGFSGCMNIKDSQTTFGFVLTNNVSEISKVL